MSITLVTVQVRPAAPNVIYTQKSDVRTQNLSLVQHYARAQVQVRLGGTKCNLRAKVRRPDSRLISQIKLDLLLNGHYSNCYNVYVL